jgi:hypothetical protein
VMPSAFFPERDHSIERSLLRVATGRNLPDPQQLLLLDSHLIFDAVVLSELPFNFALPSNRGIMAPGGRRSLLVHPGS